MNNSLVLKFTKKFVFLGMVLLVITSCSNSRTEKNNASDIAKGAKFLKSFYQLIAVQDLEKINLLMPDTVGNSGASRIAKMVNIRAGKFKNFRILKSETERISDATKSRCVYTYQVRAEYEQGSIFETVKIEENKKDQLQLLGYNVVSNLLKGINRKQDVAEGKVFLDQFYKNIAEKNFGKNEFLISDGLKAANGTNALSKLLGSIHQKFGDYKKYTIEESLVKGVNFSRANVSYSFKLKVTYEKGVVKENITLEKQSGAEIKLDSYLADSKLLAK